MVNGEISGLWPVVANWDVWGTDQLQFCKRVLPLAPCTRYPTRARATQPVHVQPKPGMARYPTRARANHSPGHALPYAGTRGLTQGTRGLTQGPRILTQGTRGLTQGTRPKTGSLRGARPRATFCRERRDVAISLPEPPGELSDIGRVPLYSPPVFATRLPRRYTPDATSRKAPLLAMTSLGGACPGPRVPRARTTLPGLRCACPG